MSRRRMPRFLFAPDPERRWGRVALAWPVDLARRERVRRQVARVRRRAERRQR